MNDLKQLIELLEWSDQARNAWFATIVPGLEVHLSSEAVFLSNNDFPTADGNHAARLRAQPEYADALIERVVAYYRARGVAPCVALSPACSPEDLPQRLVAFGFQPYGDPEHWLLLRDSARFARVRCPSGIRIREAAAQDVGLFCEVMAQAFEMPSEFTFVLEHFFGHINELPGIHNYIAFRDGEPVGCASLFSHQGVSAWGSCGLLPNARQLAVMAGIIAQVYQDWQCDGTANLLFQTVLPKLEQAALRVGFEHVFSRTYYLLE